MTGIINKRYTSVSEMLRDTCDDESFCDEFDAYVAARLIIRELIVWRVVLGLSLDDIAERMGWSRDLVVGFENSVDADLRIEDVRFYLDALRDR